MTAQSANAYFCSTLLHGAAVALVIFFAYAAQHSTRENPKVFELVAGAGNNYAATAAPALGSPGGSKLHVALPIDEPAATPAPIQPTPAAAAEAAPISPAPEKSRPSAAQSKKSPNFLSDLKRIERKREARLEAAYLKQQEAEDKRRLSKELLQKQQAKSGIKRIDAEGIREGVVGGSTANSEGGAGGKALTREQGDLQDAYFALLKARLKENHVPPDGVSDTLEARVEFMVAASGTLSGVHISKSSGNSEFDRSVLEAFSRTASIGPVPDGRSESHTMTFRMRENEAP